MMIRRVATQALFALALLGIAGPLAAQSDEPISREQLTEFARAHLEINEIRDAFHGEVARVHDAEGRLRAREQVEERISTALEEHDLTPERFDAITLRISLDGELRAMFEEVLAEIADEGG
jgi:hypothetical protein